MDVLSAAANEHAQNDVCRPHPDTENAKSGLLMAEPELAKATQLMEWIKTNPAYPVFGCTVKDKDNLFARCSGTVVGKAEWRSVGLFVSDVRFVFPSPAHCQTYFQAAMVGHPELFFDADDGSMQPRMVEMQSSDKSFLVGDLCRTFCGPTAAAREKLMASVAAGKSMEELQIIAERAIKTVHLLYLFCVVRLLSPSACPVLYMMLACPAGPCATGLSEDVIGETDCVVSRQGRVMVKLCVTTDNGLYPLGHAQALASQCKDLSARWILTAGERVSAPPSRPISAASTPGSRPNHAANAAFPASVYAKGDLRARLQERAKLNLSEAVVSNDRPCKARDAPTESAFFPVALFVAVVGDGALDSHTPPRVLERLQQATSKVPKEQIIRMVLRDKAAGAKNSDKAKDGKEVEVKLRVFVANSEDAKAVQGYIASHDNQSPAPVVVLCPILPMAMEYDALTVDPTNQGTADRLRKQAKTRAVKLVRELLVENSHKLTSKILFGHNGPSAPIKLLAESLKQRTTVINPSTDERGIVYTAGCKPVSNAASHGARPFWRKEEEEEEDEDSDEEGDEEDEEEEDGDDDHEDSDDDSGTHTEYGGLENLLALASEALKEAAASSASSTPAAPATNDNGQWQDSSGKCEEAGEEPFRLGKRKQASEADDCASPQVPNVTESTSSTV